jgi:hypothetical protein
MWRWRRTEKITWTGRVKNEEVFYRVKERRHIVNAIKRRKDNWIGHVLSRNCFLRSITEEK